MCVCRHNAHVIISAQGDIVAAYRKVHLFNVEVEGGPVLRESSYTAPGKQVTLAQSAVVLIARAAS